MSVKANMQKKIADAYEAAFVLANGAAVMPFGSYEWNGRTLDSWKEENPRWRTFNDWLQEKQEWMTLNHEVIQELKKDGRQFMESLYFPGLEVKEEAAEEQVEEAVSPDVAAASVIKRETFAISSNQARSKMLKAAYESIGATQAFTPMFGEPNAWLNELMYRDFHMQVVLSLRKYDSFKILVGQQFPPAPILIDRKSFGQSNEENQEKKIMQAYKAMWDFEEFDDVDARGGYAKFGEPNAWLNEEKYRKLHEEVIGIMEERGMRFAEDKVPMHK